MLEKIKRLSFNPNNVIKFSHLASNEEPFPHDVGLFYVEHFNKPTKLKLTNYLNHEFY